MAVHEGVHKNDTCHRGAAVCLEGPGTIGKPNSTALEGPMERMVYGLRLI